MPEVLSHQARIRFDDVGRGEPALLLLPGWCCSRAVFGPLVPRLSGRHRVLSMDLRGHGHSEQGSGDFSSATLLVVAHTESFLSGAEAQSEEQPASATSPSSGP
jgi:pimeloyl-ACP methyl ester carboxylesterase